MRLPLFLVLLVVWLNKHLFDFSGRLLAAGEFCYDEPNQFLTSRAERFSLVLRFGLLCDLSQSFSVKKLLETRRMKKSTANSFFSKYTMLCSNDISAVSLKKKWPLNDQPIQIWEIYLLLEKINSIWTNKGATPNLGFTGNAIFRRSRSYRQKFQIKTEHISTWT